MNIEDALQILLVILCAAFVVVRYRGAYAAALDARRERKETFSRLAKHVSTTLVVMVIATGCAKDPITVPATVQSSVPVQVAQDAGIDAPECITCAAALKLDAPWADKTFMLCEGTIDSPGSALDSFLSVEGCLCAQCRIECGISSQCIGLDSKAIESESCRKCSATECKDVMDACK